MSDGVETNVSIDVKDVIEIQLIGDSSITTPVNTYEEEGARVIKNGSQISDSPSITYINKATSSPVNLSLLNSTPGSYIARYSYDTKSVDRNITITQ